MSAWGVGIFSDDLAIDVRTTYRRALADGLDDADASQRTVERFAAPLADPASRDVVWLALTAAQSEVGRLDDVARTTALDVIDSGSELARWEAGERSRRRRVLERLAERLRGPSRPRVKRVTAPWIQQTPFEPGDVVAYQRRTGDIALLLVVRIFSSADGSIPEVTVLDAEPQQLDDVDVTSLPIKALSKRRQPSDWPAGEWYPRDPVLRLASAARRDFPADNVTLAGRRSVPEVPRAGYFVWWKDLDHYLDALWSKDCT